MSSLCTFQFSQPLYFRDCQRPAVSQKKIVLQSADQDLLKAQEVTILLETELSEGLANVQRLHSEVTSTAPVPTVGVAAGSDAAAEIPKVEHRGRHCVRRKPRF